MSTNPPLNSKLLYLPLREVQIYMNNLELENEKLKSELTTFSRFNCILENIQRSSNKGFHAMQIIDRNKSCVCNEHMNGQLRRIAHEADIELRVWQEQYEKLVLKTKHEFMSTQEDDNCSPKSPMGVSSSPIRDARVQSPESEPESTLSMNTNDSGYERNFSPVIHSRTASISQDSNATNDSGFRSDCSERSDQTIAKHRDDRLNANNIEAVNRYITRTAVTDDTSAARSTPLVVYESRKETRLVCDWPNCNRVFNNEDILTHHRRNHIRKSIYSCEYCSTRLLSKEELDSHMKKHVLKSEPDPDRDEEQEELAEEDEEMAHNDMIDIENSQEAVNLTKKGISGSALNAISALNNIHCNNALNGALNGVEKSSLTFQTVLYERLSATQKATPTPPAINSTSHLLMGDPSKLSPQMRSDEYKRTRYSGVGRYRCPWPDCGYTPHFLRDLRRHMFKHTGDKKHKCDYPGCDFVSVWKTSLLQHQRKKHFAVNQINTNDNLFNNKNQIMV